MIKIPTVNELKKSNFDQRKRQNYNLFDDNDSKTDFWNLSDLAILYPAYFNTHNLIQQKTIQRFTNTILSNIPEFQNINPKPIHITTIEQKFCLIDKDTKTAKIKHGTDQQISRTACEFLFHEIPGAEFEQAYFLFPNQNIDTLNSVIENLRFEKARSEISTSSKIISSMINHSRYRDFEAIWASMWTTLFAVRNMQELRERYKIKTSPMDYMKYKTLIYINNLLRQIIEKHSNSINTHNQSSDNTSIEIEELQNSLKDMALKARADFRYYGSTPEAQLLDYNTYPKIQKIQKQRINFWKENFLKSL